MNFFEAQARARRATRRLVVVYAIATLLIVAGVTLIVGAALYTVGSPGHVPGTGVLVATALLATLLIVGSTLYRTAALSAGGSRVATEMGGTPVSPDVQDPLRRRFRNVVEEMAIASGVPVPDIYVLEAESGINAFAAGYAPGDAAIAVTRGALDILNRDELQGVIAHEFSHILNGDMRINIRMMGVLFGIMVLSIIGRIVLRGGYHGSASMGRRERGAPVVMAIGIGLVILGWLGVFLARLIKAAVSRQRETLADASAVQFTRQTNGLANALKKIGGYSEKSYFRAADPEEVSHMLFARGSRRLASLFATHPPLIERIRALDPAFREGDFPSIRPPPRGPREPSGSEPPLVSSGFAPADSSAAWPTGDAIGSMVGNPDTRQIDFAQQLRRSIPESLYAAAHSEQSAFLLTLALVLDASGNHLERQLHQVNEQLGRGRTSLVRRYYDELLEAGPGYRLPLLEIAFPALKRRPQLELQFLIDLVRRLLETDGKIDLYEYCFYRVLVGNLRQLIDPSAAVSPKRSSAAAMQEAASRLLQILAGHGNEDPVRRDAALRAGMEKLGGRAVDALAESPAIDTVEQLDRCLAVLRHIDLSKRAGLIDALSATIRHDRKMTLAEAELMRAICAGLDCPLPPLITSNPVAPTDLTQER